MKSTGTAQTVQKITAQTFVPLVTLTDQQKLLLNHMNDLRLTRDEVAANLKLTSKVGTTPVSFTAIQQTAILGNPASYGLTNL